MTTNLKNYNNLYWNNEIDSEIIDFNVELFTELNEEFKNTSIYGSHRPTENISNIDINISFKYINLSNSDDVKILTKPLKIKNNNIVGNLTYEREHRTSFLFLENSNGETDKIRLINNKNNPGKVEDLKIIENNKETPLNVKEVTEPTIKHIDPVDIYERKYAKDRITELTKKFGWDKNPPKRILEFGCGSGFISAYLKELYPSTEVVCTEIYTDKKWERYSNISFNVLDISKDDYSHLGKFDYIMSFVVFEHVRLPYECLQSLYNLLEPNGQLYFSSCLWRGTAASHRYREILFPWPHLLFQDKVFAKYYEKYLNKKTSTSTIPSWVNGMTPAHYRDAFREIGYEIVDFKLTGIDWNEKVEQFYQRFINILGKFTKEDLKSSMLYTTLKKPLN